MSPSGGDGSLDTRNDHEPKAAERASARDSEHRSRARKQWFSLSGSCKHLCQAARAQRDAETRLRVEMRLKAATYARPPSTAHPGTAV